MKAYIVPQCTVERLLPPAALFGPSPPPPDSMFMFFSLKKHVQCVQQRQMKQGKT